MKNRISPEIRAQKQLSKSWGMPYAKVVEGWDKYKNLTHVRFYLVSIMLEDILTEISDAAEQGMKKANKIFKSLTT